MKKNKILILVFLLLIFIGVYTYLQYKSKLNNEILDRNNLSGDIFEVVYELDSKIGESEKLSASIDSEFLYIKDEISTEKINLPKDKFYVSLAPYINNTHPCSNHNLITCRGELVNKEFLVKVTDKNNKVIIDSKIMSYDNGFIGLWLPRNIDAVIEIKYEDKTVSSEISTYKGSNTCVTDLKLE